MRNKLILIVFFLLLSSCGQLGTLSALTGGGPNVAANTQIGAENNQALVSVRPQARPSVTLEKDSEVGTIEQNTTTNIPPWVVLLLILGWLLPSPNEISNWVTRLIRRKK